MCTSSVRVFYLDCIVMWQIECEHKCLLPQCRYDSVANWLHNMTTTFAHQLCQMPYHVCCHIMSVAMLQSVQCGIFIVLQTQFFLFATLAFVICEHAVPVFQVIDSDVVSLLFLYYIGLTWQLQHFVFKCINQRAYLSRLCSRQSYGGGRGAACVFMLYFCIH